MQYHIKIYQKTETADEICLHRCSLAIVLYAVLRGTVDNDIQAKDSQPGNHATHQRIIGLND